MSPRLLLSISWTALFVSVGCLAPSMDDDDSAGLAEDQLEIVAHALLCMEDGDGAPYVEFVLLLAHPEAPDSIESIEVSVWSGPMATTPIYHSDDLLEPGILVVYESDEYPEYAVEGKVTVSFGVSPGDPALLDLCQGSEDVMEWEYVAAAFGEAPVSTGRDNRAGHSDMGL